MNLSAANRTSLVPYLTGGVGGMTTFERQALTAEASCAAR
jgi:hypothetical protein